jgi:hypothetical protein
MSNTELPNQEADGVSTDDRRACDRCGIGLDGSSAVARDYQTRWHDRYDFVCGDCLQTDDVDPLVDGTEGPS